MSLLTDSVVHGTSTCAIPTINRSACVLLARHFIVRAHKQIADVSFREQSLRVLVAKHESRHVRLTYERHRLLTLLVTERAMQTTAQNKSGHLRRRLSAVDKVVHALRTQNAEIKQLLQHRTFSYNQRTGFAQLRGRLPFPVPGKIVTKHTITDAVNIRAARTSVRAIAAGTVVYAGLLKTLGYTIILAHGQDYYSVYGMLTKHSVKEGQQVKAGSPIASVAQNADLYFALRKGQGSLNPRIWMAGV